MTYDEWVQVYGEPVTIEVHTLREGSAALLEWRELQAQRRLWTVVESSEDDEWYIVPGAHVVNRMHYLATPRPHAPACSDEVPMGMTMDDPTYSESEDGDALPF